MVWFFQGLNYPRNYGTCSTPGSLSPNTTKFYLLSRVWLFATPWTLARQAPLSIGFSRKEYLNGLPCSPPGDLPNPGIEPRFPALPANSLPPEPPGKLFQMPVADSNHWDWIQCPQGFPGGSVVKNQPTIAGDMGWFPDPGNLTGPCTPTIEPVL